MYPRTRIVETAAQSFFPNPSTFWKRRSIRALCLSCVALALLSAVSESQGQSTANVGNLTTVYTFAGTVDGGVPSADLYLSSNGTLYGTTIGLIVSATVTGTTPGSNDTEDYGTIFSLTPTGSISNYDFATEFTFNLIGQGVPAFGTSPRGGLVQGFDPNFLYGTTSGLDETLTITLDTLLDVYVYTYANTTVGNGTVFKIDLQAGTVTTLYSFTGATDGRAPVGNLFLGSNGLLYGTTSGGTAFTPPGSGVSATTSAGAGSLFSITNTGVITILGDFAAVDGGLSPLSGVTEGGDGNFYGTTSSGGSITINGSAVTDEGTIYQLMPNGNVTTIYTFTGEDDGGVPVGGMARPGNGYLYGTTSAGAGGYGTVYKVTTSGQLTTIHRFNSVNDGGVPATRLIVGSDGNLYGTTSGFSITRIDGSTYTNYGTVFQINPNASTNGTGFQTVYTFQNGADGGTPLGGLVEGGNGVLYGTTSSGGVLKNQGGQTGFGTVYALTVPGLTGLPPFFNNEVSLGEGVYYLKLSDGTPFGYYSTLALPDYIYHFDLGYEYVFNANDGNDGIYLYDFASSTFFYTSPSFAFPYLYDFTLKTVLYYFSDLANPGHYTSDPRYFYDFGTGQIITK